MSCKKCLLRVVYSYIIQKKVTVNKVLYNMKN